MESDAPSLATRGRGQLTRSNRPDAHPVARESRFRAVLIPGEEAFVRPSWGSVPNPSRNPARLPILVLAGQPRLRS